MMKKFTSLLWVLSSVSLLISCNSPSDKTTGELSCANIVLEHVSPSVADTSLWALFFNPSECINCYSSLFLLYSEASHLHIKNLHVFTIDMREVEQKQIKEKIKINAPESLVLTFTFSDDVFDDLKSCIGDTKTHLLQVNGLTGAFHEMDFKKLDLRRVKEW